MDIYTYIDILVHLQGVPKMTNRKQILTKIECCGATFSYEYDFWERLILLRLSRKRPKTFFQTKG